MCRAALFALFFLLAVPVAAQAPAVDGDLKLGVRAFQDKRFADAVEALSRAVEQNPGQGDLHYYFAGALYMNGQPEAAWVAFKRGETIDPGFEDEVMTFYRAMAAYQARLYHAAEAQFAKLQARFPTSAFTEAATETRKQIAGLLAAAPVSENVAWYYNRGLAAVHDGNMLLAEDYFDSAIRLGQRMKPVDTKGLASAYFFLAECLHDRHDPAGAAAAMQTALNVMPKDGRLLLQLGRAHQALGAVAAARDAFSAAAASGADADIKKMAQDYLASLPPAEISKADPSSAGTK